jgi:AcrR family transcriptional regulator
MAGERASAMDREEFGVRGDKDDARKTEAPMADATIARGAADNRVGGAADGSTRRPRGKLEKSARKRTSILDAAAKVFAERGHAATLNEIAEAAGTQAGSLYYYFSSREQLIDEVIRVSTTSVSAPVREVIEGLPEGTTWLEKIAAGLRAHVYSQMEHHHYGLAYIKIIDQVPPEIRRRYLVLPRDYAIFWREMFDAAHAAGEIHPHLAPRLIRRLMFGSLNNALRWYDPRRAPGPQEIAESICQIYLCGMAASGPRLARDAGAVPTGSETR